MARGEDHACIGLSEPGASSDLANVATTARQSSQGYRVNGQKLWATGAHISKAILALVRTEEGFERNAGLSQLMIDLDTEGITIRPIIVMTGAHHFNEVFFDEVLVPLDALIDVEGQGGGKLPPSLRSSDRGRSDIFPVMLCSWR
jgi:alkylation response protein AidB-like acyl-CoA dehydrogenase